MSEGAQLQGLLDRLRMLKLEPLGEENTTSLPYPKQVCTKCGCLGS